MDGKYTMQDRRSHGHHLKTWHGRQGTPILESGNIMKSSELKKSMNVNEARSMCKIIKLCPMISKLIKNNLIRLER